MHFFRPLKKKSKKNRSFDDNTVIKNSTINTAKKMNELIALYSLNSMQREKMSPLGNFVPLLLFRDERVHFDRDETKKKYTHTHSKYTKNQNK